MAIVKSTQLTFRDSSSLKEGADAIVSDGRLHESIGVVNTGAAILAAGSAAKCVQIPSAARVAALFYMADTMGTSSLDVAVWYPTVIQQGSDANIQPSSAGAIISSSTFATAIAGVDTGIVPTDGMATLTLTKRQMPLWRAIGLSSDPGINLDVGFSVRTATAIQGYVGLQVRYVR